MKNKKIETIKNLLNCDLFDEKNILKCVNYVDNLVWNVHKNQTMSIQELINLKLDIILAFLEFNEGSKILWQKLNEILKHFPLTEN